MGERKKCLGKVCDLRGVKKKMGGRKHMYPRILRPLFIWRKRIIIQNFKMGPVIWGTWRKVKGKDFKSKFNNYIVRELSYKLDK